MDGYGSKKNDEQNDDQGARGNDEGHADLEAAWLDLIELCLGRMGMAWGDFAEMPPLFLYRKVAGWRKEQDRASEEKAWGVRELTFHVYRVALGSDCPYEQPSDLWRLPSEEPKPDTRPEPTEEELMEKQRAFLERLNKQAEGND